MKILETFRDAIQGLDWYINTDDKIRMLNTLMKVGFDYLDIGSFVSSKVIPQFKDMEEVIDGLEKAGTTTKVFALVANKRGAEKAGKFEKIDVLGFPFSTSESFLRKNIQADFDAALKSIVEIQQVCEQKSKTLIVYLAMAFGNPYNDPAGLDACKQWVETFRSLGINKMYLSDIIGVSTPDQIGEYYSTLCNLYLDVEFGLHLHTGPDGWFHKLDAAFQNGCQVFDGVISGLGGCPMTGYELLQNLPTSHLLEFANTKDQDLNLDVNQFVKAKEITKKLLIKS